MCNGKMSDFVNLVPEHVITHAEMKLQNVLERVTKVFSIKLAFTDVIRLSSGPM